MCPQCGRNADEVQPLWDYQMVFDVDDSENHQEPSVEVVQFRCRSATPHVFWLTKEDAQNEDSK